MTQAEFNKMLQTAIAGGAVGGYYTSKYSGEEIDQRLDRSSIYDYAVAGGYTGTEAEFQTLMGSGPWVPTTARQNVYVAKTGSDTTGDGSEAAPYLTVQKAVDSIGNAINIPVNIHIGPGTYDENVSVVYKFGSEIKISGEQHDDRSITTKIKALNIVNCNVNINISDIEMLGKFYCSACAVILLYNVSRTAAGTEDELGAFHFNSCTLISMLLCTISNQAYAIHAVASVVYLAVCDGVDNTVSIWSGSGYGSTGAIVTKGSSTISGTEIKSYGGQIF